MMARPDDDALSWDGDDDPTLDTGAPASVAKPAADTSTHATADAATTAPAISEAAPPAEEERAPMGNAMLITIGVLAGFYAIFTIGWVIGGLRLRDAAHYAVADVAFQGPLWLSVLAPALWFGTVYLLTRGSDVLGAPAVARGRRDPAGAVAVRDGRGGGTVSDTITDAAASAPRRNPTWLVATIAGGFGLFYAYAVWNALGNLIAAAPLGLNALGWFLWVFATVFPIAGVRARVRRGIPAPAAALRARAADRARDHRGVLARRRGLRDDEHGIPAQLTLSARDHLSQADHCRSIVTTRGHERSAS